MRLPGSNKPLTLMVVRGLSDKPLMLLTSLPRGSRKRAWRIGQSYDLEDIRLLTYERLRTMAVMVMAVAYFACVQLGQGAKLRVQTHHVYEAAQPIFGISEFRFYAIADGIKNVLFGRSGRIKAPEPPPPSPSLSLFPLGP